MTILSGCRAVQVKLLHIFCYCHLCSENKDWRWFRLQYFPHIDVTFVSWLGITKEKRKRKNKRKNKEKTVGIFYFVTYFDLLIFPHQVKRKMPSTIN